jgi:hypothetical protein
MENKDKEVIRDPATGQFVKGSSGNPAGRPLGSKNRIALLKREMEEAIRENLDVGVLKKIVSSMAAEAINGNVSAAKLILDKVMSNAKVEDDAGEDRPEIVIRIENLTAGALKDVSGEVIEHEEPHGTQTESNS